MGILEGTKLENLEFLEGHSQNWLTNAVAIGLSIVLANDIKAKTIDCRASYTALLAAREAARNATQIFYDKYGLMYGSGRDGVRLIKAFAENQPNPLTVYTLAMIPPPAPPGPSPVPQAPTNFKVELNPDGSVTLKWKGNGEGNTFWIVKRKLPGQSVFTFAGGSGIKRFTDTTIPSGTGSLEYTVFGQRGDVSGPESNVIAIRFGTGGPGLSFEMIPRLAAAA